MAVKKAKTVEQVEETVDVAVEETKEEVTEAVDDVQVDIPEEKADEITVDAEAFKVNEVNIPEEKEKKVRIRLRVDHHCSIAMERYDFKAGKTYDVPANVKLILDRAGLLAPL